MSSVKIEKRVSAVERQLVVLGNRVAAAAPDTGMNDWIDQIHGTFKNDATYRRAARLGRAWRKSQGKAPRKSSAK